jgi:RNA polymerase sigma-70 factor (ECF subfamily)
MDARAIGNVAVIRRDETFWQAAYEEHANAVLAFLLRRVGRRELAEDLLQETFVRAIRVDSFHGGNLRGYLLSIARNLMINRHRRPKLVVPAQVSDEGELPFADVAAEGASPEEDTAWIRFGERLEQAMAGLKPDHRQAFELAVMEQYSYDEIVQATGWTLPRVKSNVYRARRALIAQLGEFLPGPRGTKP